jgi:aldose 1-epimerase
VTPPSGEQFELGNEDQRACEPMTCPPNAFNTGKALIRLGPGDVLEGSWGVAR